MSTLVDLYVVYRILRKLTTPFDKWDAYKTGVIDASGNILKKSKDRLTNVEQKSFNKFDLMILKLKKLLEKLPGGKTKFASYAAALLLLKEGEEIGDNDELLSERLDAYLAGENSNLVEEICESSNLGPKIAYLQDEYGKSFVNSALQIKAQKKKVSELKKKLDAFGGKSSVGLTSDETRANPKWKSTKSQLDVEFKKLQNMNSVMTKTFGKQMRDLRNNDRKAYQELFVKEEIANNVGGGNIAGMDRGKPVAKVRRKKFAEHDVFVVDSDRYMKSRFGKKKYRPYEECVGDDEIGCAIREYGLKNPNKPIIIEDETTGAMIFLRYGKTGIFTDK